MDFRGRAYPIPPHLNHLGNDLTRGVLMFDKPRMLGDRGLWWLKIQLANVAGQDKYVRRVKFVCSLAFWLFWSFWLVCCRVWVHAPRC